MEVSGRLGVLSDVVLLPYLFSPMGAWQALLGQLSLVLWGGRNKGISGISWSYSFLTPKGTSESGSLCTTPVRWPLGAS